MLNESQEKALAGLTTLEKKLREDGRLAVAERVKGIREVTERAAKATSIDNITMRIQKDFIDMEIDALSKELNAFGISITDYVSK